VRAKTLPPAESELELVLTAHHLIADGWSCGVMLREIGELYSAASAGRRAVLSAPMQLSEWVQKSAAELGGGANSEALDYWLKELGGQLPVLDLPSDRPRPALKTFAARRANMDLGAEFAANIKATAAKCNATTFVTLLGAFQVLLHRLSGQTEFIVGFSLAGQSQIQGRDLVGHCVNFLPVRQTVDPDATFAAHVGSTRGRFLDAMEHQDCTLGTLIKKLKVRRDPSRMPLMSVAFNLDPSSRGITFHGIEARTGSVPRRYENFDIFFNVVDLGDRYQIQLTYNEALWDAASMELRMREYRRLLEAVMVDPTTAVDRLEILDEAELAQLAAWNPAPTLPAPIGSLHQRISEIAKTRATELAVVCGSERFDYAELEAASNRIARHLAQLGVVRGDLVGVCLERGARW
jgi:non-ribosomal peptide synthetase component F